MQLGTILTISSLLATSLALPALAQTGAPQPDAIKLVPHRAIYDLSLAKNAGSRAVDSARGRIVLEFTGDACEGYALKYRQVTVLESGETGARTSDLRNATFEDGDGKTFRFRTDSQLNGATRPGVDGEAAERDGQVQVKLRQPREATLALPEAVVFPTEHLRRLVEVARRGRAPSRRPRGTRRWREASAGP